MLIKGIEEETEMEGYPVITEYKYLGINIDNKLKSIMQIFGYFHKSRLLYGLPAFVD